jgi:hypothetical protein
MKRSNCRCGAPAQYSFCVLVSSLGVSRRRQKCGIAQACCTACIQKLFSERWIDHAREVQESLEQAYTAIAERLRAEAHPQLASNRGIEQQHEMFMGQEV